MRKKELWFALLLIIPTLIVGGLYTHTTRSCAVTITVHDPDQCGGQVSPSTPQRIRPGENVVIAITLGHCQSWEGQIRNTAQTLLYRATDVQARNIRIDRIAEDQQVTVIFHKTSSDAHAPDSSD